MYSCFLELEPQPGTFVMLFTRIECSYPPDLLNPPRLWSPEFYHANIHHGNLLCNKPFLGSWDHECQRRTKILFVKIQGFQKKWKIYLRGDRLVKLHAGLARSKTKSVKTRGYSAEEAHRGPELDFPLQHLLVLLPVRLCSGEWVRYRKN